MSDAGIYLKVGTIVDATNIEAASSTKNKAKERDAEMHRTQKEKQSFFGLKAHIGVGANSQFKHHSRQHL
ncbi:MAG: IS5 family transposase [Marinomonas primoryensis]